MEDDEPTGNIVSKRNMFDFGEDIYVAEDQQKGDEILEEISNENYKNDFQDKMDQIIYDYIQEDNQGQ